VVLQKPPERDQVVSVWLSVEEKRRLVEVAQAQDQRVGQLARRFINAALSTQEEPRDGRAA